MGFTTAYGVQEVRCWRPCGDYCALNDITTPDLHPIPHIQDLEHNYMEPQSSPRLTLSGPSTRFQCTKICLKGCYYNTFDLYDTLRTPECSTDLPAVHGSGLLGTLLHLCLHGQYSCSQSHIRGACPSPPDLFTLLSQYGLVINPDKCQFSVSTLNFHGHCNSSAGIVPLEDCVEAIQYFPSPTIKTSLQEFLGLVNFYHHIYPHCADVLHPLYQLLKGKNMPWIWTATS